MENITSLLGSHRDTPNFDWANEIEIESPIKLGFETSPSVSVRVPKVNIEKPDEFSRTNTPPNFRLPKKQTRP